MAGHLFENFGLPAPANQNPQNVVPQHMTRSHLPVLQHLGRCFYEVPRHTGSVEPRELRLTQQAMENVAHLVEECYNVVMPHECRL